MDASARLLFFHAVVILLISLLAGRNLGQRGLNANIRDGLHT